MAYNDRAFVLLGNFIPSSPLGRNFCLLTAKLQQLSRIAKADGRYSISPNGTNAMLAAVFFFSSELHIFCVQVNGLNVTRINVFIFNFQSAPQESLEPNEVRSERSFKLPDFESLVNYENARCLGEQD